MKRLSLRGVRLALLVYCALDLFIGGNCGGFLPLPTMVSQVYGQTALPGVSGNPSPIARPGGTFYAPGFLTQSLHVLSGNSSTGTASITIVGSTGGIGGIQLADGTTISLQTIFNTLTPLIVDYGQAAAEYVTPTSVSVGTCPAGNLGIGGTVQCATFTGSFNNTHGQNAQILEGTFGLQTAINYAQSLGGGQVVIDPAWYQMANSASTLTGGPTSTTALLTSLVAYPAVGIQDTHLNGTVYWNVTPTVTTAFSAPSALASGTAFSSTTVAGSASYTGGTIHVCYALVDLMGNEGPCSSDYSFTDTSAKAIVFTAPPAATGAIGWIPYIGVESGSAANEYQMPLFTQPTSLGAAPVSNSVCTLSAVLLASGHYACAITNSTYNQTGSGATVIGYPVVTSPQAVGTGGLSTASFYIGNSNSHTVYSYTPGANPGVPGIVRSSEPFHIVTAAASTIPQVLGTLKLPANYMNFVGRTIEVCGLAYSSTQGASTIVQIEFEWDAQGSDVTTGLPVKIGGPMSLNTLTTGTVAYFDFCQDITTTVASASATGGSLLAGHGYLAECALNTCATPAAAPNVGQAASASTGSAPAAVGSLNLAAEGRLQVIMVQTTSSTAVPQLMALNVKVLN